MKLLKEGGVLGFIVPNNLLRVTTYKSIRDEILLHSKIVKIVDLSSGVFDNVTASTVIIILQKDQDEDNRHNNMIDGIQGISDLNAPAEHITKIPQKMFYSNASSVFNIYSSSATFEKFQTIEQNGVKLGIIAETIIEGIVTPNGKSDFISDNKIDDEWKHYLEGKDIRPYYINYKGKYIRYNRELLHRPRPEKVFNCPEKLICQRIGGGNRALTVAFDNEQYYTFASTNVIILKPEISYNLKYILGILNSRFLNYYYLSKFTNKSELTVNISKTFLSQLPIKTIDFTNDVEKKKHGLLVVLVDKMIKLNKDIHMLSEYEIDKKQELEKEIKATDKKIDNLVYNLYGLTEEEIKIVEEGI